MNSADDFENFSKRLRVLIDDGVINTNLQVFIYMLNYIAIRLANLNEPMDEPLEGKPNTPPQQNQTEWNEHYGGKIYQKTDKHR